MFLEGHLRQDGPTAVHPGVGSGGRGQLVSQLLVGIGNERNEGREGELLGTGLKYSNEALGVRR